MRDHRHHLLLAVLEFLHVVRLKRGQGDAHDMRDGLLLQAVAHQQLHLPPRVGRGHVRLASDACLRGLDRDLPILDHLSVVRRRWEWRVGHAFDAQDRVEAPA